MARVVSTRSYQDDVYLVWFDGEEAIGEWSPTDGIHGSRHLAAKWSADGTLSRIKALVNVDMIGDKDLDIMQVTNSSPRLLAAGLANREGASATASTFSIRAAPSRTTTCRSFAWA